MLLRPAAAGTLLVLVALAAAPQASAGPWVRVRSAHFTVSGNVGERRALEVASKLEQFREALVRIFPDARLAVRPLFVVAFDSEKAYEPFKPRHQGRPAPVTGYFSWNSDGSCVTLQLDRGDESYPIIYHEYAHLFLTGASRSLPLWVSEGLAEYYSTTEVVKEGREVHIGRPVFRHVHFLRGRGLMVLRDLVTTTESSKLWTRADDSALFYAQAWALVHQLSSEPGGSAKLAAFIGKVAAGRPDLEAFEETFGPMNQVESALQHYIQGGVYRYARLTFPTEMKPVTSPARAMTEGEAEATKATILIFLRRDDEAASHIEAALKAEPALAEARVAQGLLARRQGRQAPSETAFRAAVENGPANLDASYYWGLSLLETPNVDAASLDRARALLAAALPAEDPPADALAVLGVLHGQAGRLDDAETLLRRSMRLMPGQTRTTVGLADVLIREGKFDEARAVLGPMIAKPAYPGEADVAKRLLQWLSQAEMRAKLRDELAILSSPDRPDARAPAAGTDRDRPADARPPSPPAADGDRAADGRPMPALRAVRPGERRQAGLLEGIECGADGMVLRLKTTAGEMRFHAVRFDDVAFISHREDVAGSVRCGERSQPEAVYVTWKPMTRVPVALSNVTGRAVAVEFLPK